MVDLFYRRLNNCGNQKDVVAKNGLNTTGATKNTTKLRCRSARKSVSRWRSTWTKKRWATHWIIRHILSPSFTTMSLFAFSFSCVRRHTICLVDYFHESLFIRRIYLYHTVVNWSCRPSKSQSHRWRALRTSWWFRHKLTSCWCQWRRVERHARGGRSDETSTSVAGSCRSDTKSTAIWV